MGWVARYEAASPAARGALAQEGVALARSRRERMLDLIRRDPEKALSKALAPGQLRRLPPAVQDLVEQRVSGRATTSLFQPGGSAGVDGQTRNVVIGGRLFRAYVYGNRASRAAFFDEPVEGVAVGNALALKDGPGPGGALPKAEPGEICMTFRFDPADLSFSRHEGYDVVDLREGCLPEGEAGAPWLPVRLVNIQVPAGAVVTAVTASARETLVRTGFRPYPFQPEVPRSAARSAFVPPDPAVYGQAEKYPARIVESRRAQRLRGFAMTPIRLNPVRCAPSKQELYLAEEIEISVQYVVPSLKPLAPSRLERFKRLAESLVINPGTAGAEPAYWTEGDADATSAGESAVGGGGSPPPPGTCAYLIVTKASLTNAFRALADHRAAHNGFTVEIVTVEWIEANYDGTRPSGGSDTQTKIRNCIRDYVQNHATEYVVLGGDNTIVPDRDCLVVCGSYSNSTCPTDFYYAGLDGDWDDYDADGVYGEANVGGTANDEGDLNADVFVGRIPVRTAAQATTYINRVIAYETNPPYDIVRKFMMGGKLLWNSYTVDNRPSDTMNDGHMPFRDANHPTVTDAEMWARRAFRDAVQLHGWNATSIGAMFDTLTSWDSSTAGDYAISPDNLVQRFSQGWYWLIFDTHGGSDSWSAEVSSFRDQHALALTGQTVIVYTMACNSGGFDAAEPSLSEGFLRAVNGGALVYLGSSRYGWGSPDAPPASNYSTGGTSCSWMRKFLDLVIRDGILRIGDAFFRHKAAFIYSSGSYGSSRWLQMSMNLQGDPALDALVGPPEVTVEAVVDVVPESGVVTGRVVFTREGTAGDLAIHYARSGSAAYGADYWTAPATEASGSLVIPGGSSSTAVDIVPVDDGLVEENLQVLFTLEEDGAYGMAGADSAVVLIVEDDTDGDGMPDDWESQYGLDPGTPGGDENSDTDVYTDYQEYVAGTDPTDGKSRIVFEGEAADAGCSLSFETVVGRWYRVEWNDDLRSSAWSVLADELAGTGGTIEVSDSTPEAWRFYRLCVEIPR